MFKKKKKLRKNHATFIKNICTKKIKKKKEEKNNNVTSQNCIGPTIRIGREIQCLPYAGFLLTASHNQIALFPFIKLRPYPGE